MQRTTEGFISPTTKCGRCDKVEDETVEHVVQKCEKYDNEWR